MLTFLQYLSVVSEHWGLRLTADYKISKFVCPSNLCFTKNTYISQLFLDSLNYPLIIPCHSVSLSTKTG